ncbi:MAG TPA: hypothetical protein VMV43_10480 [Candidatus Nanopelagicaceae bacterium]|nr:hypothetical protein [Candidatus Nanopelagicaceae bacterium]
MSGKTSRHKKILKELEKYNRYAKIYLRKNSLDFKTAYNNFQKSEAWTEAKALLIEYFSLGNEIFTCPICNIVLDPYYSTLHHIYYDNKKLFDPKYINLVHHDCHERYHQKSGIPRIKKHMKVYIKSRGFRIYIPKLSKLYIRYEFCVLLIIIIMFLVFYIFN